MEINAQVAGRTATVMTDVYQAKLSSLYMEAAQSAWPALREAFVAKYGEPCKTSVEPWRNAAGASFDNVVERWCFASGTLQLRQYGSRVTKTTATYLDSNQPPKVSPTVDF